MHWGRHACKSLVFQKDLPSIAGSPNPPRSRSNAAISSIKRRETVRGTVFDIPNYASTKGAVFRFHPLFESIRCIFATVNLNIQA